MSVSLAETSRYDDQHRWLFEANRDLDAAQLLDELVEVQVPMEFSDLGVRGKLIYLLMAIRYSLPWPGDDASFQAKIASLDEDGAFPVPPDGNRREEEGAEFLSADELRFFRRYGILGPFSAGLDDDALDEMTRRARTCYRLSGGLPSFPFIHLLDGDILDLAFHETFVQKIRSLIGDDVDLVRSTLHIKEPGEGGRGKTTAWHNDSDFANGVQIWLALTDATREQGCMRMIPRSFLVNRAFSYDQLLSDNFQLIGRLSRDDRSALLKKFAAVATNTETARRLSLVTSSVDSFYRKLLLRDEKCRRMFVQDGSVSLPAKRGEFYICASHNHHCSLPNESDDYRIAIALRYASDGSPVVDRLFEEICNSESKYRNSDFMVKSVRLLRRVGEATGGYLPLVKTWPRSDEDRGEPYVDASSLQRMRDQEGVALENIKETEGGPIERSGWRRPSDSHT